MYVVVAVDKTVTTAHFYLQWRFNVVSAADLFAIIDHFSCSDIKDSAQFFVLKVILSADPISSPDYVVATVYSLGNQLAFIKPNQDSCWTYIDKQCTCFTDIIFYKSLLYAVGRWGWVVSFDVHNKHDSSKQLEPNTIVP